MKARLLILSLVALVVVLIAGYHYVRLNVRPINTSATATTTTSSGAASSTPATALKTYSDPEYGFSFSYPAEWTSPEIPDAYRAPYAYKLIALENGPTNYDSKYLILVQVVPKNMLRVGVEPCILVSYDATSSEWIEKTYQKGPPGKVDPYTGCLDTYTTKVVPPDTKVGNVSGYVAPKPTSSPVDYVVPLQGPYGLEISVIDRTDHTFDDTGRAVVNNIFQKILDSFRVQ